MPNIGRVYNKQNYIIVEFNGYHIESMAPIKLKEIKSIKEFDTSGYFVLDTNYGEEYLDLGYVLEELESTISLEDELKKVDEFEVGCIL